MDTNELKDFVIEDQQMPIKEGNFEIFGSSDDLEKFDFSSEKEFNIDEFHEIISFMKKSQNSDEMKELIKLQEAKNIIEKDAKKFLDPEFVDNFQKEEENLLNMIKRYDPNIAEVRNMTETDKDKLYEIAQYLFNIYQKRLNDITFHFPLTNDERKFVYSVFRNKLEYDQNEIFQLKEVKENYLDKEFDKNGEGIYDTFINVNDLIIFYHLISKYKVKGITQEHYDYLQILTKIGERIKLFNAYNVIIQRLSNDFQLWGGALTVEGELEGRVLEPQNQILNDINSSDSLHLVDEQTGHVINK